MHYCFNLKKEKFTECICALMSPTKFFFPPYTPRRILWVYEFCFNFCAQETYLVISGLFQKRNLKRGHTKIVLTFVEDIFREGRRSCNYFSRRT